MAEGAWRWWFVCAVGSAVLQKALSGLRVKITNSRFSLCMGRLCTQNNISASVGALCEAGMLKYELFVTLPALAVLAMRLKFYPRGR